MKSINRIFFLAAFLLLTSFSQTSHATIIKSYTALFEDGSSLVVDLKGYDYGRGSYYAAPTNLHEFMSAHPYTEPFDTYFYPSNALRDVAPVIKPGKIESDNLYDGLNYSVDEYHGVSMISFNYFFFIDNWSISDNVGIYVYDGVYHTNFSDGFFKTYIPPYDVNEPGILALLVFGIASLAWTRQRGKRTLP